MAALICAERGPELGLGSGVPQCLPAVEGLPNAWLVDRRSFLYLFSHRMLQLFGCNLSGFWRSFLDCFPTVPELSMGNHRISIFLLRTSICMDRLTIPYVRVATRLFQKPRRRGIV